MIRGVPAKSIEKESRSDGIPFYARLHVVLAFYVVTPAVLGEIQSRVGRNDELVRGLLPYRIGRILRHSRADGDAEGNSPPTSMGSPCTCVRNPSINAFISALESPSATMANSSPPIRKAENLASESLESFFPICRRTWSQAACQNPSLTRLKLSMSNIANPIRSTAHSATFDTSFSRCESKCLRLKTPVSSSVMDER